MSVLCGDLNACILHPPLVSGFHMKSAAEGPLSMRAMRKGIGSRFCRLAVVMAVVMSERLVEKVAAPRADLLPNVILRKMTGSLRLCSA